MKVLNKFSDDYFLKYKEKPVNLVPYNPRQQEVSDIYLKRLSILLNKFAPKLLTRGSTAFKIFGKGEVEVGVYPKTNDWEAVLGELAKTFGEAENLEKNYARFNDICEEKEVEIIVLKGYEAKVDIKLHEYLISHPKTLKNYEIIKKKYSFSKREYQKQKNNFLTEVIGQIPK